MARDLGPASPFPFPFPFPLLALALVFGCAPAASSSEAASPTADDDSASHAADTPEQSVREAFSLYISALESQDGEAAAALVTSASIAHYEQTLAAALDMDAETLRGSSAAERLAVLTVRARHSPEELATIDGRTLFITSVERGWVGRHIVKSELREVEVSGELAMVTLRSSRGTIGEPTPAFQLVDGQWLFDLTAMLPHAAKAIDVTLTRMTEDGELSEEAALMQLLVGIVGRELDDSIWQPVGGQDQG